MGTISRKARKNFAPGNQYPPAMIHVVKHNSALPPHAYIIHHSVGEVKGFMKFFKELFRAPHKNFLFPHRFFMHQNLSPQKNF
ncbi:MAG: hypothetical protein LUF29_03590 [Oscillospiraceae bacterium]|nr:hypothetical protein [Oscillospiraceae bacterium]